MVSTSRATGEQSPRQRWEYRAEWFKPDLHETPYSVVNPETLQRALNAAGEEGWELVSISGGSGWPMIVVFKRPA